MVKFPVSVQKSADLAERMRALQLGERDLQETYGRANAVTLLHRPSGTRIRCGPERSQGLNRFLARRMLVEELEARRDGQGSRHEAKAARMREEKLLRGRRGSRPAPAFKHDPVGGAHLFDPNGAMAQSYFLRPMGP